MVLGMGLIGVAGETETTLFSVFGAGEGRADEEQDGRENSDD